MLVVLIGTAAAAHGVAAEPESNRTLEERIAAVERENALLRQAIEQSGQFRAANLPEWERPGDVARDETTAGSSISVLDLTPASAAEPTPAAGAQTETVYEVGSDTTMSASWHNGLEIESKHHDFRVHIGGRTQFDMGWFTADPSVQDSLPPTNRFREGLDFRRARFRIDGVMYETMEWAAEFDFANSAGAGPVGSPISVVAPTDLWWQWNHIPWLQHFRVGNVKEPIGFEHLTSSRFLNFMERSFLQDAFFGGFNNGFTPGACGFGTLFGERATYALGIFNPATNVFGSNVGAGEYSVTARLTALPTYREEGRRLVHLGMSARHWELDEDQARFRTRASVRAGASPQWPVIADTGNILGESNQQINAELVSVFGPWSFASEFLTSWLQGAQRTAGNDVGVVVYRGGYVEALYFLTGEHRAYNPKTGAFDRVAPYENAFLAKGEGQSGYACGRGAWQLGARYQYLDLNSNGFNGGILHDTTLGLNWFLNPNFKVQANCFFLHREAGAGSGDVQGFGIRLAHDF